MSEITDLQQRLDALETRLQRFSEILDTHYNEIIKMLNSKRLILEEENEPEFKEVNEYPLLESFCEKLIKVIIELKAQKFDSSYSTKELCDTLLTIVKNRYQDVLKEQQEQDVDDDICECDCSCSCDKCENHYS